MKIILFILLFFLVSCSSLSDRAPVHDVKSKVKLIPARSGAYIASGSKIEVGQKEYTVEAGDTLYSIAWRAGMDVNLLIQRNHLKKPYIIRKGEVLKLQFNDFKRSVYSQKTDKNKIVGCTGQTCKKNNQSRVVKQVSKEYSANNVDKRTIKKQVNTSKVLGESKVIPIKVHKEIKQEAIKEVKKESFKKISNWQWPSKGKLTKTFASSSKGMKGISISNVVGTPVYAAAAGKVVYAGSGLRGYGNLIIIKHNYDYLSAYAHNENIIIKENEQVKVGQKIAVMGNTGTDSVRLHFDIRYRGKSVDPLRYLPKR